MRKILEILSIESWLKDGEAHYRTLARLDNQNEAQGYGIGYEVGEEVEAYWDDKWHKYSMKKHIQKDN